MENNTLCNRHSLGVNNHTKMYVTYTRIYGWSDYGGESSYQPGYRLENMMWMTLLVYDYIIPGENTMNKKEIIDELHKMGYEVKEETLVKNGVNVLGVSIIDSDRFMIPVFHIDDIIKKAESIGATARAVAEEMLDIHNDAIRESEELDKPLLFSKENFKKNLYVAVQKESKEDIIKRKTEFEGIEKYLFLRINAIETFWTTKIKRGMLQNIDMAESEAWAIAEENLAKEIEIARMTSPFLQEEKKMFIISNKVMFRGASAVLNREAVKVFAEIENVKRIIVIPSSIHEMILIPCYENEDVEEELKRCSEIVEFVNEEKVDPTERLTNRAYLIAF